MKTDSPAKKHHFWILLGVVPLFTLIAVLVVSSSVGGKIDARTAEINKANDAFKGKSNPKSKPVLQEAGEALKKIESRQGGLHKENWELQKYLFTWPNGSALLKEFDQANLKFGAPLPGDPSRINDQIRLPEVYLHEFSSLLDKAAVGPGTGMADKVAPTQFKGGWQQILRYVTDFGTTQVTKDQVWLIMEDIWVQRSLLDAVATVNADMAAFRRARRDGDKIVIDETFDKDGGKIGADQQPAPTPDDEKLKGLFRNRTWAVELAVVKEPKEGTGYRLTGSLTNLTERLQLMGTNNAMVLRVWFGRTGQNKLIKIGGEYLPGKGARRAAVVTDVEERPDGKGGKVQVVTADGKDIEVRVEKQEGTERVIGTDGREVEVPANVRRIVFNETHRLPAGIEQSEIVRVDQVFDVRTVPIKRIDELELGALDSRNAGQPLVQPKYLPPPPEAAGADAGEKTGLGGGSAQGGPPGPAAGGMPPGGKLGMGGGFGGGGGQADGPTGARTGDIKAVIDGNKKRYLTSTDQVRRMPVGLTLLVEQSYIEDVLLAYANSPLRFQITQVTWRRYHGPLEGATGGGATDSQRFDVLLGSGSNNIRGGSGDPDASPGFKPRRPGSGSGAGPLGPIAPGLGSGSDAGRPIGPGPVGPGPVGPGPGGPRQAPAAASGVSESQITAGLVELNIYGIISLYEKAEPPKDADTSAAAGGPNVDPKVNPAAAPTDKAPKDKVPGSIAKEKDKAPDPMDKGPMDKGPADKGPAPGPMDKGPAPGPMDKEKAPGPMDKAPKSRRRVRRGRA